MFNEPNIMPSLSTCKLAVIGLGYVGLPLAVEFGKTLPVVGYDVNVKRIEKLRNGQDMTLEVEQDELKAAQYLTYTNTLEDIAGCNVYIVTVPTPIDEQKRPDLSPLIKASQSIGGLLKRGDIVIYESTVYPGATEEDCVPILEQTSGLKLNEDFFVGYSPERINPGDKAHRLTSIIKVTSGSTPLAADFVNDLYGSIISAGTYRAPSIRVAEAAKVIENTQRDLNIALANELAMIFNRMNIDTGAVLEAAGTKWNFLPFSPGLVGGHCIGVDPYYLTTKAEMVGYHPQVILAGRRINDGMGKYIANQVVKQMVLRKLQISGARVLVLGLTFKENCPDIRNTRVIDVISELKDLGVDIDVNDPWANPKEVFDEYGISLLAEPAKGIYDAVILAVPHTKYIILGSDYLRGFGRELSVFVDVKSALPSEESDWRL